MPCLSTSASNLGAVGAPKAPCGKPISLVRCATEIGPARRKFQSKRGVRRERAEEAEAKLHPCARPRVLVPEFAGTVCAFGERQNFLSIGWICARTAPISGSGVGVGTNDEACRRASIAGAWGDMRRAEDLRRILSHNGGSHDADNLQQNWNRETMAKTLFRWRPGPGPDGPLAMAFVDDGYPVWFFRDRNP